MDFFFQSLAGRKINWEKILGSVLITKIACSFKKPHHSYKIFDRFNAPCNNASRLSRQNAGSIRIINTWSINFNIRWSPQAITNPSLQQQHTPPLSQNQCNLSFYMWTGKLLNVPLSNLFNSKCFAVSLVVGWPRSLWGWQMTDLKRIFSRNIPSLFQHSRSILPCDMSQKNRVKILLNCNTHTHTHTHTHKKLYAFYA